MPSHFRFYLLSDVFVCSLFRKLFTNIRAFLFLIISLTRKTVFLRRLYLVKAFNHWNISHGMLSNMNVVKIYRFQIPN